MSSIMREDWIECNLDEVCEIQTGKYDANHAKIDGNYRFYTCAFDYLKCNTNRFGGKSIILPGNGANVGEVFYYDGEFDAYQRTYVINDIKIDAKYLYYNLKGFWKIRNIDKQFGSATNYVRIGNFTSFILNIAPLPIQRAIVSKIEALFSDLDNGIANFKKAQEQLKIYRQAVLKKAFEGGYSLNCDVCDSFDEDDLKNEIKKNHNNHTNQKNHSSDNLPKGWKWVKVSDVCDMKAGYFIKADEINSEFENGLFPCYGGNGLRGYVRSTTHEGLFPIVGRQGALCGNVHLVSGKFHATEHAVVVSAKKEIDIKCLYYKLTEMKINQYATGTAQPGLSVNKILPIVIIYPSSLQEQAQIVQEIESRLSVCDKMEQSINESIEKAEALRQSILKKAFEGKLLSQAEIELCKQAADYEPASELLKKIQADKLAKELEKKKPIVNLPAGKAGKKSKQ